MLRSRLRLLTGRRPQAHDDLREALTLAGTMDVVRPLVAAPPEVVDLLERHLGGFGDLEPVARRVLALRPAAAGPGPAAVHLTGRELDVLGLLPTPRSLDEIAAELAVSHSTVKTHVKAIYTKLDAGSRRDAVTAARRRGLLSPGAP